MSPEIPEFNTLSIWREIVSVHWMDKVVLNHLIGHIFMMQMDSLNSGFDSGSRAHFRSE